MKISVSFRQFVEWVVQNNEGLYAPLGEVIEDAANYLEYRADIYAQ